MNEYVNDHNPYYLGKDKYGKKHDVRDVHPILIKLILELDRICRKYQIGYALSFGSALGLYNYGDFIPWDDDMDIAINYKDIYRLKDALKEDLGEEFSFDCYEDNKRFNVLIPTFKIRYKDSYILEKFFYTLPNRCKNGNGIFIDIVAFMGVPEDKKEHRKLLKFTKRKTLGYVLADALFRIHPYKLKEKIKNFEKETAEKYQGSPMVSQTVIIPFQDWAEKKENLAYPREVIYPFREYDFHGYKLYSFNKLEEFCRLCYGEKSLKKKVNEEWIDPFPMKKRKSKHNLTYALTLKKK